VGFILLGEGQVQLLRVVLKIQPVWQTSPVVVVPEVDPVVSGQTVCELVESNSQVVEHSSGQGIQELPVSYSLDEQAHSPPLRVYGALQDRHTLV